MGFQAGVIGHVPLTEKVNGFAKAGWGNDIKQTYQVGAQYEVRPDIDLNLYYGYDKYSVDSNDKTAKGLHAGVGYSFYEFGTTFVSGPFVIYLLFLYIINYESFV